MGEVEKISSYIESSTRKLELIQLNSHKKAALKQYPLDNR